MLKQFEMFVDSTQKLEVATDSDTGYRMTTEIIPSVFLAYTNIDGDETYSFVVGSLDMSREDVKYVQTLPNAMHFGAWEILIIRNMLRPNFSENSTEDEFSVESTHWTDPKHKLALNIKTGEFSIYQCVMQTYQFNEYMKMTFSRVRR